MKGKQYLGEDGSWAFPRLILRFEWCFTLSDTLSSDGNVQFRRVKKMREAWHGKQHLVFYSSSLLQPTTSIPKGTARRHGGSIA